MFIIDILIKEQNVHMIDRINCSSDIRIQTRLDNRRRKFNQSNRFCNSRMPLSIYICDASKLLYWIISLLMTSMSENRITHLPIKETMYMSFHAIPTTTLQLIHMYFIPSYIYLHSNTCQTQYHIQISIPSHDQPYFSPTSIQLLYKLKHTICKEHLYT